MPAAKKKLNKQAQHTLDIFNQLKSKAVFEVKFTNDPKHFPMMFFVGMSVQEENGIVTHMKVSKDEIREISGVSMVCTNVDAPSMMDLICEYDLNPFTFRQSAHALINQFMQDNDPDQDVIDKVLELESVDQEIKRLNKKEKLWMNNKRKITTTDTTCD